MKLLSQDCLFSLGFGFVLQRHPSLAANGAGGPSRVNMLESGGVYSSGIRPDEPVVYFSVRQERVNI